MAIVKSTKESVAAALARVDWAKIDAMTDEDIARQITENPDAAPDMSETLAAHRAFARRVRDLRSRLDLTQSAFADRFRIPVASIRDWEQGRRLPDSATQAYLMVIEKERDAVERALS